ncbi:hypothetical protein IWQ60_007155 [Tieghemiomyces parasiticus]|uniref:Uncharacterized protein n=1 Tax=Tieghemiomyces parasiticus TaxID=78921 RepID=A0A9W8DRH2_9FUNG|nr:hypothetical protein IWQ60_007155 [Tieghemiomyces parasiticus]
MLVTDQSSRSKRKDALNDGQTISDGSYASSPDRPFSSTRAEKAPEKPPSKPSKRMAQAAVPTIRKKRGYNIHKVVDPANSPQPRPRKVHRPVATEFFSPDFVDSDDSIDNMVMSAGSSSRNDDGLGEGERANEPSALQAVKRKSTSKPPSATVPVEGDDEKDDAEERGRSGISLSSSSSAQQRGLPASQSSVSEVEVEPVTSNLNFATWDDFVPLSGGRVATTMAANFAGSSDTTSTARRKRLRRSIDACLVNLAAGPSPSPSSSPAVPHLPCEAKAVINPSPTISTKTKQASGSNSKAAVVTAAAAQTNPGSPASPPKPSPAPIDKAPAAKSPARRKSRAGDYQVPVATSPREESAPVRDEPPTPLPPRRRTVEDLLAQPTPRRPGSEPSPLPEIGVPVPRFYRTQVTLTLLTHPAPVLHHHRPNLQYVLRFQAAQHVIDYEKRYNELASLRITEPERLLKEYREKLAAVSVRSESPTPPSAASRAELARAAQRLRALELQTAQLEEQLAKANRELGILRQRRTEDGASWQAELTEIRKANDQEQQQWVEDRKAWQAELTALRRAADEAKDTWDYERLALHKKLGQAQRAAELAASEVKPPTVAAPTAAAAAETTAYLPPLATPAHLDLYYALTGVKVVEVATVEPDYETDAEGEGNGGRKFEGEEGDEDRKPPGFAAAAAAAVATSPTREPDTALLNRSAQPRAEGVDLEFTCTQTNRLRTLTYTLTFPQDEPDTMVYRFVSDTLHPHIDPNASVGSMPHWLTKESRRFDCNDGPLFLTRIVKVLRENEIKVEESDEGSQET